MEKLVYMVEVGYLIGKGDADFGDYSQVYNKKHGFCNDDNFYVKDRDEAVETAKKILNDYTRNTYAIVSEQTLSGDKAELIGTEERPIVENACYDMNAVVYSRAVINGDIVEDFLNKEISI